MESKYKKGDWVRVVYCGGDPDCFTDGQVCQVTAVHGRLVYCGDGAMYPHRFEPWQPKVGERVRYVGGEGRFYTDGKDYDVLAVDDIEFSFTDDSGAGPHFWTASTVAGKFIPTPITDTLPVAETLRITAGRYYKTRDGRKVGPMERADHERWSQTVSWSCGVRGWYAAGNYYTDHPHEIDLIAEWVDTPVAITAATVDAINDGYGPVVREVPKFKVGDRVRFRAGYPSNAAGKPAVVVALTSCGVQVDSGGRHGVSTEDESDLVPIRTPTTAIVALIKDGQPLPADRPVVHTSAEDATKEARRLASAHKGREFGVFTLGAVHKEAKVYEHEWQRLAAEGRRPLAVSLLVRSAGIPQKNAEIIVYNFAA